MRVLHVISGIDPVNGGPVTVLSGLARAQAAAGLRVSVVSTFAAGANLSVVEELKREGVAADVVGPASGMLFTHPDLKARLQELISNADLVHIHSLWEDIQHQAARAAQRVGVPYVLTAHGMLDPWSLSSGAMKKKLYMLLRMRRNLNRAAALHYATDVEKNWVAPLKLAPPAIVEPFGVDLREFETLPPKGEFQRKFPAVGGRKYVLFLGRIHRGKGLEILVPAFAKANVPNTVIVVAGPDSGGYRAQMEALIEQHKIADRVVFTGMVRGTDRIAALAEAEVLCLPSEHESFGMVVVEALAAGTPAIVSDQVTIHSDVTGAGAGAAAPLNVDAFARELQRWLGDDALRATASKNALTLARERYNWTTIGQHWMGHYERVLQRTPKAAAV
jgi:glycosyltransferase involved in cell wall biosynthesis